MADRVAHGVAGDGGGHHHDGDDPDVDAVLGGHDSGDEDRGLAGENEADEEGRFAEDEQGDESVDESAGESMYLTQQVRDDGSGEHPSILLDSGWARTRFTLNPTFARCRAEISKWRPASPARTELKNVEDSNDNL